MIRDRLIFFQRVIDELIFQLQHTSDGNKSQSASDSQDQYPDIEYFAGSKQTCAIEVRPRVFSDEYFILFHGPSNHVYLQVDDEEDLDTIAQLIDPNPPQGFLIAATERVLFGALPYVPKKNIQLFTQIYRYRIPTNTPPSSFNKVFYRVVQVSCQCDGFVPVL